MKTLYTCTYKKDWFYKIIYTLGTLYASFLSLNYGIWYMQQAFGVEETLPIMMSLYLGAIALSIVGFILAVCGVGDETKAWALKLAERRRRIPRKKAVPAELQEKACRQRAPFPAICRVETR